MSRPTYRVHLVTHPDGNHTGRLLSRRGTLSEPLAGFGPTEEVVLSQLALALDETNEDPAAFLWEEKLHVRRVTVKVNPQMVVKDRIVIGAQTIAIDVSYAWATLKTGGVLVMLPRFGWWYVLEDVDMAPTVIRQAIAQAMLGEEPASMFDFRRLDDERIIQWSPTYVRRKGRHGSEASEDEHVALNAVAEDMGAAERHGRRRPIVGEPVPAHVVERFCTERPRSVLLVGESGAGKSTWVRALARALSKKGRDAPKVWATSADRIVAGMVYLGQWEQRCLDMVEELTEGHDILYVDRLAPICATQTSSSIADMLAPAMQRGELVVVAECSPGEFDRLSAQYPAFVSRFSVVRIEVASSAAMPQLLADYQRRLDPSRTFSPKALQTMVRLLQFFARDQGFPGKGVRFLDWLARAELSPQPAELDANAVTEAFVRSTGLPSLLVSDRQTAGRNEIAAELQRGVIGQDAACRAAAGVLTRFKAGLCDPERPIGSLFFVGPTGVGKTELAKQLARVMFSGSDRMVRLDMSEFMLPGSAQRLLSVGRGSQSLVEQIRRQPLSLILLDEIEKAHPEVFDLLLAMLGEGRMTDTEGRLVDFRMTLVVMTSNLGVSKTGTAGFGAPPDPSAALLGAVRAHFRPEFFNRLDFVVPFGRLSPSDIERVVELEIAKSSRRQGLRDRQLTLHVSPAARAMLAKLGWHPTRGARPLKRIIEERVISPIAVQLSSGALRGGSVRVVANEAEASRFTSNPDVFVVSLDDARNW